MVGLKGGGSVVYFLFFFDLGSMDIVSGRHVVLCFIISSAVLSRFCCWLEIQGVKGVVYFFSWTRISGRGLWYHYCKSLFGIQVSAMSSWVR
jgi:hypothetical protein